MTIDDLRSQAEERQILPQNRILNWIRNLVIAIIGYYIWITYLIPYLNKYELYINYTPMIILSLFSSFIWLYLFNKYNFFIKSFTLDLSSLPVISNIKPSTEELTNFSYYYQGKPLLIIYQGEPIPHDHLKLSAGLDMANFFKRFKKIQVENIQLQQYKDLVIGATIELLDDIKNETNLHNLKKEVINYYEGLTSETSQNNELINQQSSSSSELGFMETIE